MHGMFYANMAADKADLVIGVGMRFDDRAMGRFKDFNPGVKIVHIDIDPAEIGKNFPVAVPIVGSAANVLPRLAEQVTETKHVPWTRWIDQCREEHPSLHIRESRRMLPQYVVRTLYEETNGNANIVTGVGQHQMWAGQHYFYKRPGSSSAPAASAPWASNCPAPSVRRSPAPMPRPGPSAAMAASR